MRYVPKRHAPGRQHLSRPGSTPTVNPPVPPAPPPNTFRPIQLIYLLQHDPDDTHGFTNDHVQGVMYRLGWSDIQTGPTTYDWSRVDHFLALAEANEKQFGITVVTLSDPPDWLDATRYQVGTAQKPLTIVLPWDAQVQPALLAFTKALCLHIEGEATYICPTGIGATIESFMHIADPLSQIGETLAEAIAHWTSSTNKIMEVCNTNLRLTPFIFSAGVPFNGTAAQNALKSVVDTAMGLYPNMGVMCDSGAAKSQPTYLPNALVIDYSATHPCGMEFLTSAAGFGGHELGGTWLESIEKMGSFLAWRGFVHVYPADADDPDNATDFDTEAAKLT